MAKIICQKKIRKMKHLGLIFGNILEHLVIKVIKMMKGDFILFIDKSLKKLNSMKKKLIIIDQKKMKAKYL